MMMGFLMLGRGPLRQRSHYEVLAEGVGGSAAAYLENRQGEDNTMMAHLVTLRAPCRKGMPRVPDVRRAPSGVI